MHVAHGRVKSRSCNTHLPDSSPLSAQNLEPGPAMLPWGVSATRGPCRCQGSARNGLQCSITSRSTLLDGAGRLAAGPLLHGGARCSFHATWLCLLPAATASSWLLCYLDLETTGLSLRDDEICEIGVVAADSGARFSTVVRPPILPSSSGVHGIDPLELAQGPSFAEAFRRLSAFLEELTSTALSEDGSSSSQDGPQLSRLRSRPPTVLLAAHNGLRFDFPMLASSCVRHGVALCYMEPWCYVDTLELLRAVPELAGGCAKLQCQRALLSSSGSLRAHRALDDAVALNDVIASLAGRIGAGPAELLGRFARKLDVQATSAELPALLA
jgi:DNA polymerase III epsilon subunit-like protein